MSRANNEYYYHSTELRRMCQYDYGTFFYFCVIYVENSLKTNKSHLT
jgi:hypothetical protein